MSFDGLQPASGPIFLGAGQSVRITIWFGNLGDDHGAQWIMAHPIAGQPPTELRVSDFSKILHYSHTGVTSDGEFVVDALDSYFYRYGVTVTNLGKEGVFFNLQGGGND